MFLYLDDLWYVAFIGDVSGSSFGSFCKFSIVFKFFVKSAMPSCLQELKMQMAPIFKMNH